MAHVDRGTSHQQGQSYVQRISPEKKLYNVELSELWRFRALIPLLVRRDFYSEFSQTILGPGWFVVHPVMQSVIFALVFGRLGRMSTNGATPFLFYNAAFVLWTYFTLSSTYVANVFINNAGLFGRIYFPRLIIPISIASFRLVNFAVNFLVFMSFLLFFHFVQGVPVSPNIWVLITPLLLIQVIALSLGIGTLASALTSKYRDMQQAVSYVFSVWMYATPLIYPLSQVPGSWKWLFALNPMASAIELFRHAWLGAGEFTTQLAIIWACNVVVTVCLLVVGIIAFHYAEKDVVDTV